VTGAAGSETVSLWTSGPLALFVFALAFAVGYLLIGPVFFGG